MLPEGRLGHARTLEMTLAPGEGRFFLINATHPAYRATWAPPETARRTLPLNGPWRFALDPEESARPWAPDSEDAEWEAVPIPHSWNTRDPYDLRGLADGLDIGPQYHRGVGWYRLRFTVPPDLDGRALTLRFLGAANVAEVWLDGERLGRHVGGFTPFRFDVTGRLRPGREHVLAVRVDNRFDPAHAPHAADFTFYGGLYREVLLEAAHPTHLARVHVDTPEASLAEALVRVRSDVVAGPEARAARLVVRVEHPEGGVVASALRDLALAPGDTARVEQTLRLTTPLLWGPDHPHLYAVHATLYDAAAAPGAGADGVDRLPPSGGDYAALDHRTEPLGVRFFDWTPDQGFALNGARLELRGVNLHQDYPLRAHTADLASRRRDLELAKAMGANFVRLAHYPHHPAVYAMADTLGLLVWAEIPFITSDPDREGFAETTERQLVDLIETAYNHPSIVLWGLANENVIAWQTERVQASALALTRRLHETARRLDPGRLTAQAQNHVDDPAVIEATDIQGRNQYFGWYEGHYSDLGPALDAYHAEHPHWRLLVSEYGADHQRGRWVPEEEAQPFDFSETWALRYHEAYLDAIEDRPFVAGGAVWHLFDFGSHVKTGTLPHINQKGLLTADRRPKASYFLYQSRWTDAPMVYLLAHSRPHLPTGPVRLEAFTNAERAELFVDGVSQGVVARPGRSTRIGWDVTLAEGVRRLRVAAHKDGQTVTDEAVVFAVPGLDGEGLRRPVQLEGDN